MESSYRTPTMKPASNLREIVTGLWFWSSLHEEWKVDFSSCAWKTKDGLVLIDPIKLAPASLTKLEKAGKPVAILLTNQNHERHADWFRKKYGIKVHVHRDAVPGIEITPDEFFCDGAAVPGGLKVIHLPGSCPSESAFYAEANGGMVLAGDVVTNAKKGLAFLSDDYCDDAKQSHESARKLLKLKFETLTVAHGNPIHPKAHEQFAKLFNP
jgi:glyoxylase-like metal-dependent hydrolase (beta-lactamase superfamily II)